MDWLLVPEEGDHRTSLSVVDADRVGVASGSGPPPPVGRDDRQVPPPIACEFDSMSWSFGIDGQRPVRREGGDASKVAAASSVTELQRRRGSRTRLSVPALRGPDRLVPDTFVGA